MNGKHAWCTGVGLQGTASALSFLSNLEELDQLFAFSDKVRSVSLPLSLSLVPSFFFIYDFTAFRTLVTFSLS
jgi:hypothetical protein